MFAYMFLKIWRFLTILITSISMSAAVAHLLELPAKIKYDGRMWLTLLQTLYPPGFGTIGGYSEAIAVIMVLILTFLVRRRRPAFGWTVFGAICLIATHAAFRIWVQPVNTTLLPLTPDTLPENWIHLRNQWEYTPSMRAILQLFTLSALVISILVETPTYTRKTSEV
jgi:hypothetical protein